MFWGLQKIRRPDLDQHGAWLTMGNIDLHLIHGKPVVPSSTGLDVSHISLTSTNMREVSNHVVDKQRFLAFLFIVGISVRFPLQLTLSNSLIHKGLHLIPGKNVEKR